MNNITEPKVTLVNITSDSEGVIESAARSAYRSVKKVDTPSENQFIRGLIKAGHESVLEHASATFFIEDVSRALTHQLVRHRLASFTQESQRYCTSSSFDVVMPKSFQDLGGDDLVQKVNDLYQTIDSLYNDMLALGIKKEDARYILPNACTTKIMMTANFREWRHIIALRTEIHAQWEIRSLTNKILVELNAVAPNVFFDLVNSMPS